MFLLYQLWRKKIAVLIILILILIRIQNQKEADPTIRQDHYLFEQVGNMPLQKYNLLLNFALENGVFTYTSNEQGRIAWNTAYFLDSLINIFELTQDTYYLDVFAFYADAILAVRDDINGREDFLGRSRPGWQTNSYYTLGVPQVLFDVYGRPSLQIQGIHSSGNNHTEIRIIWERDNHFTIEIYNDFRRESTLIDRYENVTMDIVETEINSSLSPNSYIRVTRVGEYPPAEGRYLLKNTYVVVLHELHTPSINIPFVRFSIVVNEYGLRSYKKKSYEYLQRAQESYEDYKTLWRRDEEGGYFVFDPQTPIWSAGLPVPYNGLALHGRFFLWMYEATGKQEYLEKACLLLSKIRSGIKKTEEGFLEMPYWYGTPYLGWQGSKNGPAHKLYTYGKPRKQIEDVSHFTLTLQFLLDALERGVLSEQEWAYAAARTYTQRIWKPACQVDDEDLVLSRRINGEGCFSGYPAGVYARLASFDEQAFDISLHIYKSFYADPLQIDSDYEYGYILLGWSWLATHFK